MDKFEMKIEVDIPDDVIETVVIEDLQKHLGYLAYGQKPPFFSHDEDDEIEHITLLRNAFKTVLEYYGVKL